MTSSPSLSSILTGRGLWYGAPETPYTLAQFDTFFAQAVAWGIQVVHPKVADGGHLWYSVADLHALKALGDTHGLKVVPYHYCYGNKWQAIEYEAAVCALIGTIFDIVIPDIEEEWENHPEWAPVFGNAVRASFKGEIVVTTYANWSQHPVPYEGINVWANGFLPQVYFDVWTNSDGRLTAQEALNYVYPEWLALTNTLAAKKETLQPIYPIIELDNRLAASEVQSWIELTHGYGYCGFWYADHYAPYANAIRAVAIPGTPKTVPAPAPKPVPVPTHPVQGETTPVSNAVLSDQQLALLWHSASKDMVLNPGSAIYKKWREMVLMSQSPGAPTHNEQIIDYGHEQIVYVTTEQNKKIVYFRSNGLTVVV